MERGKRHLAPRVMAEFTAITVGVLVAFGVQDWADRRADRLVELQYLERLAEELRGDSAIFVDAFILRLAFSDSIVRFARPISRGAAPFPADTISFLADLGRSHSTPFLWILGDTYEELLATGSLTVLESPELRSAVVSYYSFKRVAGARAEWATSDYGRLIRSYIPQEIAVRASTVYGSASAPAGAGMSTEELLRDAGVPEAVRMIQTSEFTRALNERLGYLAVVQPTVAQLLARVERLIPRVDEAVADLR